MLRFIYKRLKRISLVCIKLSLLSLVVGLSLVTQPLVAETLKTEKATLDMQTLSSGLNHPWAMQFLPDGSLLVTNVQAICVTSAKLAKKVKPSADCPRCMLRARGGS